MKYLSFSKNQPDAFSALWDAFNTAELAVTGRAEWKTIFKLQETLEEYSEPKKIKRVLAGEDGKPNLVEGQTRVLDFTDLVEVVIPMPDDEFTIVERVLDETKWVMGARRIVKALMEIIESATDTDPSKALKEVKEVVQ